MSVFGVPVMTKKSFIQTEKDIGEWWRMRLNESMLEAGKEEKRLIGETTKWSACHYCSGR